MCVGLWGLLGFLPTVASESQHCGKSVNPEDFSDFMEKGIRPKELGYYLNQSTEITNHLENQQSLNIIRYSSKTNVTHHFLLQTAVSYFHCF